MKQMQKLFVLCLGILMIFTGCQSQTKTPTSPEVTAEHFIGVSQRWVPLDGGGTSPQETEETPGNLVISDPLTTGTSVGIVSGGVFTPEGFKVTTHDDGYIAYSTDIYNNIRIEFDAKGYMPREDDGEDGKMVIIEVFDSPHEYIWQGDAWDGPYYLYHLRRRGAPGGQVSSKTDGVELKFGGRGDVSEEYRTWEGESPMGHPVEWDPNDLYHWVITIQDGETEITRNDEVMFSLGCHEFTPDGMLNVRIGGVPYDGRTGSKNVTYSNVKIYRL